MSHAREEIVAAACDLLERQGFHATGLSQIVRESGAPKGSLYYYFPDGKDAIAEAAITQAGDGVAARISAALAESDVAAALPAFVETIATFIEASAFRSGGPLMTVALETATTNERLNRVCRAAYARLQGAFEARLVECGYPGARELATFITAAIEGGTMLSRVYHSGDPLRMVAAQLGELLRAARAAEPQP